MFNLQQEISSSPVILITVTILLLYYQTVLGYIVSLIIKIILKRKILKLNKNVKIQDEEDLVILSTSMKLEKCNLQGINLSPFVGSTCSNDIDAKTNNETVENKHRRRTYLLGLSLTNFELVCRFRIKVQNIGTSTTSTHTSRLSTERCTHVDSMIQISFEAIRVNLFSLGLLLMGYKQLRNMIDRIRKNKDEDEDINTNSIREILSQESEVSILSDDVASEASSNPLQTPLYILHKIVGSGELIGFRVSANTCFSEENENENENDSDRNKDRVYIKWSLRSTQITAKLKTSNGIGRSNITFDVGNLKTRLRSGSGDGHSNKTKTESHSIQTKSVRIAIGLQSTLSAIEDGVRLPTSILTSIHVEGVGDEGKDGIIGVTTSRFQLSSLGDVVNEWMRPLFSVFHTMQRDRRGGANTDQHDPTQDMKNQSKERRRFIISKMQLDLGASITLSDNMVQQEIERASDQIRLSTRIKFESNSAPTKSMHMALSDTSLTQIPGTTRLRDTDPMLVLDTIQLSVQREKCNPGDTVENEHMNPDHIESPTTKVILGNLSLGIQNEEATRKIVSLIASSHEAILVLLPSKPKKENRESAKSSSLLISCMSCAVDVVAFTGVKSQPIQVSAETSNLSIEILSYLDGEKNMLVESGASQASFAFVPHDTLPTYDRCAAEVYPQSKEEPYKSESKQNYVKYLFTLSKYHMSMTQNASERIRTKNQKTIIEVSNASLKEYISLTPRDMQYQTSELVETDGIVQVIIMTEVKSHIELQRIDIGMLCSNVKLLWSPVLHWHIVSAIKTFREMIGFHLQSSKKTSKTTNPKKNVARSVIVQSKKAVVTARFALGGASIGDIVTVGMILSLTNNETDTWEKPDVLFQSGRTRLNINNNNFDVVVFDSIRYFNGVRRATSKEITDYSARRGDNIDLHDEVVTGNCGTPLVEMVEIGGKEKVTVDLPPNVDLGKFIEDITTSIRVMDTGLEKSELVKPKRRKKRKYQLMDISLDIPVLDVHFLEAAKSKTFATSRFGKPQKFSNFVDRWRFLIKGFNVKIRRHTPPDVTQTHLRNLDEDKSRQYTYGPMIQGGEFYIAFDRVINTLHPLNLATPLGDIKGWKIEGLIFLASLNPEMKNLIAGRKFCIPVKCHHNCSSEVPTQNQANSIRCNCDYAMTMSSSNIPPKIYYDLNVTSDNVHSTFGDIVQPSISGLMKIIQRLIPKPPLVDPRAPPRDNTSPPLTWWDNLRHQWHGQFKWKMKKMSFRWLLDTVPRYDWSILLTSTDLTLSHSTGMAALEMNNVMISIPDSSYHMLNALPANNGYLLAQKYLENNKPGFKRLRHPLILFPKFKTNFKFKWAVSEFENNNSSRHHDVYIADSLVISPSADDKFEHFRSQGWDIEWKFQLHDNKSHGSWIALRGDVLPWITHKSPRSHSDPSDNDEDALPRVNGIQIDVDVSILNIGAWFDEHVDNRDNSNVETSLEGIFLHIPKLHYCRSKKRGTSIDLYGAIRAALLEIDKYYDAHDPYSEAKSNSSLKLLDWTPLHHPRCCYEINDAHSLRFFNSLQESAKKIRSLDYLLKVDQIKILDRALEDICQNQNNGKDHSRQFKVEKSEAPWTVLVAGMKLLWTVDIRDSVIAIVKDVLFAINFMQVNSRGTPQLLDVDSREIHSSDSKDNDEADSNIGDAENDSDECIELVTDDNRGVYLVPIVSRPSSPEKPKSHLDHLLNRHNETFTSSPPMFQKLGQYARSTLFSSISPNKIDSSAEAVLPTFDLHLTNPQIQFHSEKTGGSIIIGIRGAYIEGKKFTNLLVKNEAFKKNDIRLETLFRRTEFVYTLDRMELFSVSNSVDVGVGLQWLTVDDDSMRSELTNNEPQPLVNDQIGSSCLEDEIKSDRTWIFPKDLKIYDTKAFAIPFLGESIMNPSTFKTRQEFHRPPIDLTKEELDEVIKQNMIAPLEVDRKNAFDYVEFFIDELSFHLDSYQFSTTLDIIRNTMLEPLKPREERYYQKSPALEKDMSNNEKGRKQSLGIQKESDDKSAGDDAVNAGFAKMTTEEEFREDLIAQSKKSKNAYNSLAHSMQKLLKDRDMNPKKWREHLREIANELIADLEDDTKGPSGEPSTRHIEYNLCKAKWKIEGDDSIDNAEINFTDFKGVHDFSADGSVSSKISLEDMHITSSNPGSDATIFADPTIIVQSILGEERSPCQRCGLDFDRGSNEFNSCRFHTGSFRRISHGKTARWSCCGADCANAGGCVARPHTGNERAMVIQFDAFPRVVEGITMYKFIEANFYPGVTHTTIVQLTRSLTKSFMKYFLGDSDGLTQEERKGNQPGSQSSVGFSETSSDRSLDSNQNPQFVTRKFDKKSMGESRRYLLFGEIDTKGDISEAASTDSLMALQKATQKVVTNEESDGKSTDDNEIVFLRNWKIGGININLSIAGFHKFIDTFGVSLVISEFSRAYKVGSVQHLVKKFLGHLIKNLAKSSLGILKVKIAGNKNNRITDVDNQKQHQSNSTLEMLEEQDETDDDAATNLLLAPPKMKQKKKKGGFFRNRRKKGID